MRKIWLPLPKARSVRSTSAASIVPSPMPGSTPGRPDWSASSAISPRTRVTWAQPASSCPATASLTPIPAPPRPLRRTRNLTATQRHWRFGVENVIFADAHSTYHALQTSLSGTVGHGGPGIQASYTWGKSIDNTSLVLAARDRPAQSLQASRRTPMIRIPRKGLRIRCGSRLRAERGPGHAHGERQLPPPISRKVTDGWEMLSISSISSGSPFTVFSGIQQTGAGFNGVDRPDQTAKPQLSTRARTARTISERAGTTASTSSRFRPRNWRNRA